MQYDHKKIEPKWQKTWEDEGIYRVEENSDKPKQYVLGMFPYPSGDGLHIGHPRSYTATDIYSRHKRMNGYNVLHPMGWDAFGLPAENYAIKNGLHPREAMNQNIDVFRGQLKQLGFAYDWTREVDTTDPEYYQWTQWVFLQMYQKGLAYESHEPINWCPQCQTGLANEDLETRSTSSGQVDVCERCGSEIEQKPMRQWVLKIRDYADRMLEDLENLNWPESVKESQRNWIGRSEGAELSFELDRKFHFVLIHGYKSSPRGAFFAWLREELESRGHSVEVPELPHPDDPSVSEQVETVLSETTFDENTIVLGHSLGSVVGAKAIEKRGVKIHKFVTVAGFVLEENTERAKKYLKTDNFFCDYEKVRENIGKAVVLQDTADELVTNDMANKLVGALDGKLVKKEALKPHFREPREPEVLKYALEQIDVFTTRPDTLFGATYMVLAPEHLLVSESLSEVSNRREVESYIEAAGKKSEIDRTNEEKEKTGVKLEGLSVKNPASGETLPIYIADYVLAHYGTGAIMAVPAHDERDWQFARKYDLPVRQVIRPVLTDQENPPAEGKQTVSRKNIIAVARHPEEEKLLALEWMHADWTTFVTGGVDDGEDIVQAAKREVEEETGYRDLVFREFLGQTRAKYFASHKDENKDAEVSILLFDLKSLEQKEVSAEEKDKHAISWISHKDILKTRHAECELIADWLKTGNYAYSGVGELINSGEFDGMDSEEAKTAITELVGGEMKSTYRLQNWVFSRQRYWGEPIPLVHCTPPAGGCGVVPVPEEELPVTLPEVERYEPTGTGESPLAGIEDWVNTECPECGGSARRETNTMPQWAGSCWYYLRYMDPGNDQQLVDPKKEKYWSPVDVYVGGVEHATRHLIYARFWHKFLYDIGVVSTVEPFARLENQGLILAEDGQKMSKRYGNVINPETIVEQVGADTLRVYEMFMGPFDQSIAWSTDHMTGARRFLERVWRLVGKVEEKKQGDATLTSAIHETVAKVEADIEQMKFNTAISALMKLTGELEACEKIDRLSYETLLLLLAPFAPHITEELWREELDHNDSVHKSPWPVYKPAKIAQEKPTIGVQINGKVRDSIELDEDASEDEALAVARELENARRYLEGAQIKKVIYVPGKILNIIIGE